MDSVNFYGYGYMVVHRCRKCGKMQAIPCRFSDYKKGRVKLLGEISRSLASDLEDRNMETARKIASNEVNEKHIYTPWLPNGECNGCKEKYPWNYRLRGITKTIAIIVLLCLIGPVMDLKVEGLWALWGTLVFGIWGIVKLIDYEFEIIARKKVNAGPDGEFKYPYLVYKEDPKEMSATFNKVMRGEIKANTSGKRIMPVGLIPLTVGLIFLAIPLNYAAYSYRMTEANLLTKSQNVGNKSVVLNQDKVYTKNGLSPDEAAGRPEEVRYIYIINEERVKVGDYVLERSSSPFIGAYRIDYNIEKYDRNTGGIIGSVYLEGTNPPLIVELNEKKDGEPPSYIEVEKAISDL